MIKLPSEDGAWYMVLAFWACGWAAAFTWAWEPLAVGASVVCLLAAAQSLRSWRRLRNPDPPAARRSLALFAGASLAAAGLVAAFASRLPAAYVVPLSLLPLAYVPFILLGKERSPGARLLAVAALSTLAPVTYAAASGTIDRKALVLWIALGGYLLLGSLYVMARLRRSAAALWAVRLASSAVFVASPFCPSNAWGHWVAGLAFLVLAARAWAYRPAARPVDPRRVGKAELAYSALAALLVLIDTCMR